MTKNFMNFHVLISHPTSCLNRDDMNMQKSAVFGGTRRVRISSQCLKRAIRKSPYYEKHIGSPSIRTRRLGKFRDDAAAALSDRYPESLVDEVLKLASGKKKIEPDTDADAVAPWVLEEIAFLCEQVQKLKDEGVDDKKWTKMLTKQTAGFRKALNSALDVALSGRMATSGLMSEMGGVDGALAMAHVITTHTVDSEVDWFTAVDDLKELGSGHLDTQELSAGVFYRYASLNLGQLQTNLGNCDRDRVLEIAAHFLHMFTTVVPTAKSNSTAAFNPADMVMVSFADMPISLANAFERPVKTEESGGFMGPSIKAFQDYWEKTRDGFDLDDICAAFSTKDVEMSGGVAGFKRLSDLKTWVKEAGA